ncbi:lanC-like protein 2 [Anticarsia gemmatalis]|uniref:lanC-like protein 2 n=1 Tax=Anticarsia gemmatalis TaxID=129554 RepID=UPI003F760392
MATRGSFQNNYEEFTADTANNILNESNDELSEKFKLKLKKFQQSKLELLTGSMVDDIFCDGTVYTGSAGLALYYFNSGIKNESNSDLLKTALEYIDLDRLKGRRISFLCGDAGPLAIATIISYKLGSRRPESLPDYKTLAQNLMSLISLLNDSPDELLYGKAGYLYALLFVNKHIHGKELIPAIHIEKVISSIVRSGKQFSLEMKSESPLLWQWHDKIYLGAAHGMAGILYMLLQARIFINIVEMRSYIRPAIDWLLNQRFPSGNFPSSLSGSSSDRLVQWCHGAPGFVQLCVLAAQVFGEESYMKIAHQACDIIWQRGLLTKGYSICHGVSGNAYAFINMYQATKKPVYLYRACCFMEWCAVERRGTELHHPDRPASLFEGIVGRIYLAQDITNVLDAKFPAYSL